MSVLTDFFHYDFLLWAMISTIILALLAGILSPLIIAGKQAFMGTAVSHSTFLGLAIAHAFFPADSYGIYLMTLLLTLGLAVILAGASFKDRLPFESFVGVFFSVSMGMGILVLHLFGEEQHIDLLGYMFGDILLINQRDVLIAFLSLLVVSLSLFLFFGKWIYFIVDRDNAKAAGQNTPAFHYGLVILVTLTVVSSLKVAGVVLVNTMLLVPGIFALKTAYNIKQVFLYSVLFSLVTSIMGLMAVNLWDTPSGATMSCIQFIILLMALLLLRFRKGGVS